MRKGRGRLPEEDRITALLFAGIKIYFMNNK
jgi:hypothetical protein